MKSKNNMEQEAITMVVGNTELLFNKIPIIFQANNIVNVFSEKNNKTLEETIKSSKYIKYACEVNKKYAEYLSYGLGTFLLILKKQGDPFYRYFLNEHGDSEYCTFAIEKSSISKQRGLYCFCKAGQIMYIGRSHDPYEKRINQGYGKIHPKNCFKDGQSTNCHINNLISNNYQNIDFYVCPLDDDNEINFYEESLIKTIQPTWNIQLKD